MAILVVALSAAACVGPPPPAAPTSTASPSAANPSATAGSTDPTPQPLPSGFVDEVVVAGLHGPSAFRVASDGAIVVAELRGTVQLVAAGSDHPELLYDLRERVHHVLERGLMDLELAPDFATTQEIWVVYSLDGGLGHDVPRWGGEADTDPCPGEAGACAVAGRLSRVSPGGTETVLIEDWCQPYWFHSLGRVWLAADGALYVSAGEGANGNTLDYGGEGDPPNACGDPPAPPGTAVSPPNTQGGSLRAQSLDRPAGPVTLSGTIIRVSPDTGEALADNPLAGHADANARRIVGYGLRNPFRFAIRPGTDELWIGDVGALFWEEINVLDRSSSAQDGSVPNFGWPCYEGDAPLPGWPELQVSMCEQLYETGDVQDPWWVYHRSRPVSAVDSCDSSYAAMTGLAFYDGAAFPSEYDGALFIADFHRSCIWVMTVGDDGDPDPASITTFHAAASTPVDLQVGPDGSLYYLSIGEGTLRRIRYVGDQ